MCVLTVCVCRGSAGCGRLSEERSDASYKLRPQTAAAATTVPTQRGSSLSHTHTHGMGEGKKMTSAPPIGLCDRGRRIKLSNSSGLINLMRRQTVCISSHCVVMLCVLCVQLFLPWLELWLSFVWWIREKCLILSWSPQEIRWLVWNQKTIIMQWWDKQRR